MNTEIWISCMFYGSKIFSSFDFLGAFQVVQVICSPYKIQKYAVGQIWVGLELPDPQVKGTLNLSLFSCWLLSVLRFRLKLIRPAFNFIQIYRLLCSCPILVTVISLLCSLYGCFVHLHYQDQNINFHCVHMY